MKFRIEQIKNKRGDVPVTILVLGVVAVCILAIASFYLSNGNVKKDFAVLSLVENANLMKDRMILYQNLGYSNEKINQVLGITEDGEERYYYAKEGKISVKYNLPR